MEAARTLLYSIPPGKKMWTVPSCGDTRIKREHSIAMCRTGCDSAGHLGTLRCRSDATMDETQSSTAQCVDV